MESDGATMGSVRDLADLTVSDGDQFKKDASSLADGAG